MKKMFLALVLTTLIACGSEASPAPGASGTSTDFTVTTFEGEEFSTADARGKPLVLNFWESW